MTTIVKHKRTGNEYILLGINGEVDKTNPSRFISELFTQEKSELSCSATVCDVQGNIFLAYIDDLVVTEIDGKKPAEILPEPSFEPANNDVHPQKRGNFEVEENLVDEDLGDDQYTSTEPQKSAYSQDSSTNSDFDDDDDDWV